MDKAIKRETLEQSLFRDLLDVAHTYSWQDDKAIEGMVEHIKSTFAIYGYRLPPDYFGGDWHPKVRIEKW